jgi:ribonuclease HI
MNNLTKTALAEGTYVAYTDGSCKPNPGTGGVSYRLYLPDGQVKEAAREQASTTSNRIKMHAVIDAIAATPEGASALICLDSGYIKEGIETHLTGWLKRDWRKANDEPVANQDLWKEIIALSETRTVAFHKVKARSGDPDYERVGDLARDATDRAIEGGLSGLGCEGS